MQESNSEKFIKQARLYSANLCYSTAFDTYISVFEKWPHLKAQLETEFRAALTEFNEYLLSFDKVQDIFFNLERAMECFPGNIHLYNDIGSYLYKFNFHREALTHFQRALNINAGFVSAEKNMNSVKNYLVARWHFRMLNDKARNDAYRKALYEAIMPGKEAILDLGTGTGLLAMYARECFPMMIAACDASPTMIEIATEVFQHNKIKNIVLLNKYSSTIDHHELAGKRTLIVTELFDAGLLGEHILKSLRHAWNNLMEHNARVIPCRAEFFVAGVNCNFLSSRYRLGSSVLSILNTTLQYVQVSGNEPYDSEDVCFYKDFNYITEPQSVLKVNFNSLDNINQLLIQLHEVVLKAKRASEINIIVGWFDLHLTDNVTITTDPRADNRTCAWQQAVFYHFIPKQVKENDEMALKFSSFGGKLSLVQEDDPEMEVSADMVRFLNDSEYVSIILNSVGAVFIYLCQIIDESSLVILDMCPFPLLGLMLMRRGARHLTCYALSEKDKQFILKVFSENDIPESNVTIILDEDLYYECFKGQKFHVICTNIIELCGDLNSKHKQLLKRLKSGHLATGGLALPYMVTLEGQLVFSDWVERNNLVKDANVHDYKIAQSINKYQVSQNFCVDIAHLEYRAMTEVTQLATCSEDMPPKVIKMSVTAEGLSNAVLCWYKTQFIEGGEVINSKRVKSYIDSTLFRIYPKAVLKIGANISILRCVDDDDAFKLITDYD